MLCSRHLGGALAARLSSQTPHPSPEKGSSGGRSVASRVTSPALVFLVQILPNFLLMSVDLNGWAGLYLCFSTLFFMDESHILIVFYFYFIFSI